MKEAKEENDTLQEHGAFEFWKKKRFEAHGERDRANAEKYEAFKEMREEQKLFEEEEREARRKQEDVDRLRRERNERRDYYDGLFATWEESGHEYEEEAHETGSETSEATASYKDSSKSKISRKEADKISIPNWPRIHEFEFWNSQVTSNIVAASRDLDHDAWTACITPAFKMSPDIDGVTGKLRRHQIQFYRCETC